MTARNLKLLARLGLVLLGGLCLFGMFGPYHDIEQPLIPWDKASHFIAFYALTFLTFLSFPKSRRTDLTPTLLLVAAGSEIARVIVGHGAEIGDFAADALGVIVVFATTHAEQMRRRYRESPYSSAFSRSRRGSGPTHRPVGLNPPIKFPPHSADYTFVEPGAAQGQSRPVEPLLPV